MSLHPTLSTMHPAIKKVLDQARKDLGMVESPRGSNRGKRVEEMLATTGLGGGWPWCAAATSTWGKEALGASWPVPITADCDVILAWARKNKCLYTTPEVGDLGLRLARGDRSDAQHVFLVTSAGLPYSTIEGNTNNDGSAEGYGVFELQRGGRGDNKEYVYVRWVEALHDDALLTLAIGDTRLPVTLLSGRGYAPLRDVLLAIFPDEGVARHLGWDTDSKRPCWGGEPFAFDCWQDEGGNSLAPIRPLAAWLGLEVRTEGKSLRLARPGAEEAPKKP